MEFVTVEDAGLEGLFRRAALAVSGVLFDPESVVPGSYRDRLHVEAADPGSLLVLWLEDIVRQWAVNGVALAGIPSIQLAPPDRPVALDAVIEGELADPGRHKARHRVTSIRLETLEKREKGWFCRLALAC